MNDYEMIRGTKSMRMKPETLHINFISEFDKTFLKALITLHYGFENARPIHYVTHFIALDTDKEFIAIKLYDDRSFHEYVIEKK